MVPGLRLSLLLVVCGLTARTAERPFTTWSQYLGGADSSQYSALKQINKSNVTKLDVAWTYPTGPGTFVFDPIVVDGVMYVLAQNNSVAALDERTGKTINSFGHNGRTDLRIGLDRDPGRALQTNNPGRIFEDIVITPLPAGNATYDSTPADIHAWSVITGKPLWTFHVIPHPGEFGYDTWPPDAWKTVGGVHNWNEMTIDEKRGIAYIPLGTARYDFYGANRKGNNLFANSLLALDVRTGKRLWHYQLIHHDLWDYDYTTAKM